MTNENQFSRSGSTVETQRETASQNYSAPSTYISPEQKINQTYDYSDDYSVAQNFTEETGYQASTNAEMVQEQEVQTDYNSIYAPVITKRVEEKPIETVTLTKTRQVIHLTGRLKMAMAMFMVIMASLIAIIAFNFSAAGRINGSFSEKQARINELQLSITELTDKYNLVSSDGYLQDFAENANFVVADESNTVVITLNEMYERETVQEVPSNWFNDVCDFFSKLFG